MKKKVRFTITADPDPGFLPRLLLVFSRRKLSLSRFYFEGPAMGNELHCQLELKLSETVLTKIIRQVENILGVRSVMFDIIHSDDKAEFQYSSMREKDYGIIN
ncbi:hypothetical protein QQ020_11410 [Fulvivirgaceae bacterium BMA12]|uniref:Acetolactate synthase n=1 Tax=Agaribacillus aureus TaxID=3051825 RepID=A0ABT8L796_9BACT|nr:hypothetical protein [Fulvivirgaceae bacterium BMA12]